jgi:hypothetical protein
MARAIATPSNPEIRNRSASENRGEASATMIRAEVKADDQMKANASPMAMARKSMVTLSQTPRLFPNYVKRASAARQNKHRFRLLHSALAVLLIDQSIKAIRSAL